MTTPEDDTSRRHLIEWVPRPSSGWPQWQFDGGYISRKLVTNADLVTDPDDETVELDQAHVLIYDNKLVGLQPILWLLESVIQSCRPLLIVAEDVGGEALASLVLNQRRGSLKVGAARAPGVGDRREVMLRDIANLTGGMVISEDLGMRLENVTLDMLGSAGRVVIGKSKTTIIRGGAERIRKAVTRRLWPENSPGDGGPLAVEMPGAMQPTLADWMAPRDLPPDGWLNLWQLAKAIAPKTCHIVVWWVGIGSVPMAVHERAKAHLMATDPSVRDAVEGIRAKLCPSDNVERAIGAVWVTHPEFLSLLDRAIAHRMEQRRRLGKHLLLSVIPDRLRCLLTRTAEGFPKGRFEVTARTAGGQDVTLTPRDLVALDIDLWNNTLTGDGTVYGAVRVRPRATALPDATEVAPPSAPGQAAPGVGARAFGATGEPPRPREIARNTTGPSPVKREATRARMIADYVGDPDRLAGEKQEVLRGVYGVSRDTAEKARRAALLELRQNSDRTPIIDK